MAERRRERGSHLVVARATVFIHLLLLLLQVSGDGIFQVLLTSFNDDSQSMSTVGDIGCCEMGGSRCSDGAGGGWTPCRTSFRVCLSHYQENIPDEPRCTYGEKYISGTEAFPRHAPPRLLSADGDGNRSDIVRFPFSFTWPETYSLIIDVLQARSATVRGYSYKQRLVRVAVSMSTKADRTWREQIYANQTYRLSYNYSVVCATTYYGPFCSDNCKPRDDKFGHYYCSESGHRECKTGWSGSFCDKAVCLPGCSTSHGSCDEPNECKCSMGWQGQRCDRCIPWPGCHPDHGTCGNEPWTCVCETGWGGSFCNQDLAFCTNHRPCRNGATCQNSGLGSYVCLCQPGFTGVNCETEQISCRGDNITCLGPCTYSPTRRECLCPAGFQGWPCALPPTTDCDSQPCRHGASCVATRTPGKTSYGGQSRGAGFQCICALGYTGKQCEIEVNECQGQPCLNGGRCIDDVAGYRCACRPGYGGDRCQSDVNDCAHQPCLNGGECIDKTDDFDCRCVPGFVGELCQTNVDECLTYPCANGASCRDLVNDFECACAPGWVGRYCTVNVDDCASRPCVGSNSTCIDRVADFDCQCEPGRYGRHCESTDPSANWTRPIAPPPTREAPMATQQMSYNSSSSLDVDPSVSLRQLLLVACLSVCLPLILTLVTVACLVSRRRRRYRRHVVHDRDGVTRRDNERNCAKTMNNRTTSVTAGAARPLTLSRCHHDDDVTSACATTSSRCHDVNDVKGGRPLMSSVHTCVELDVMSIPQSPRPIYLNVTKNHMDYYCEQQQHRSCNNPVLLNCPHADMHRTGGVGGGGGGGGVEGVHSGGGWLPLLHKPNNLGRHKKKDVNVSAAKYDDGSDGYDV